MKIFILTGGIGSGKSTAGAILRQLGAAVIDSDLLAKRALEPGSPAFLKTVDVFGQDILTVKGRIDRKKLGRIVFRDPEALLKLNKIVHPQVNMQVEELLCEYESQGKDAVFIEMAILAEAPFMRRAEGVWVIKSAQNLLLNRLRARGMSEEDVLARMANQPPVEEKIKNNLIVIPNDGGKDELRAKISGLWDSLIVKKN